MALIRVFLLCYKRNDLLPRAIQSLLDQTFQDWICELHCDDPLNTFPQTLLTTISDDRIILKLHPKNLGLTESFNLAFGPIQEEYRSILEEDNWWEKDFLETMILVLRDHPRSSVAWANMWLWHKNDKGWYTNGKKIWEIDSVKPIEFSFPHPQQIKSALHSQGALLLRSPPGTDYIIPFDLDSGGLEGIRERIFTSPMILVPQVLGNYAMLEETHRSNKESVWSAISIAMVISFFLNVKMEKSMLLEILEKYRKGRPKSIHILLLSKFVDPSIQIKWTDFKLIDYLFSIAYYIFKFKLFIQVLKDLNKIHSLRNFLNTRTSKNYLEYKNYVTNQ